MYIHTTVVYKMASDVNPEQGFTSPEENRRFLLVSDNTSNNAVSQYDFYFSSFLVSPDPQRSRQKNKIKNKRPPWSNLEGIGKSPRRQPRRERSMFLKQAYRRFPFIHCPREGEKEQNSYHLVPRLVRAV